MLLVGPTTSPGTKGEWLSSALEDRPRRHRCLTLTPVASQLTPRRRPGVGSAARRASKTFRPTNTPKKLRTRRLRHEPRVEFSQGARVVDPAFGMGCRVRHPNILTSRERSGIFHLPTSKVYRAGHRPHMPARVVRFTEVARTAPATIFCSPALSRTGARPSAAKCLLPRLWPGFRRDDPRSCKAKCGQID